MMTRRTAKTILIVSVFAMVVGIGIGLYAYQNIDFDDDRHFELDETELVVVNTTGARVSLFKAGDTIDSAKPVDGFDGKPVWLPKGDYFLRADNGDQTAYYPVNILGYRSGPERDGTLAITIRLYPDSSPPDNIPLSQEYGFVPPGYFLMGDRKNPNEPHYVWTQGFFISKFEVSNAEFQAFLKAPNGYSSDSNWTDVGLRWHRQNPSQASSLLGAADTEFRRFGQPDMPVTQVTWYEAAAYCRWLTTNYGSQTWIFSMPTEAEWEKAARGPDGFDFPLAETLSDNEVGLYNWKKNPLADRTVFGIAESREKYIPNRFGIYHLGGNVVEWTQSTFEPMNRQHPYEDDERNREDRSGERVARGGSWYSASTALLYIPYRDVFVPELLHHDLGFRIVARRIP